MALLRQCLQELRLRRGDMDLLFEEPQPLAANWRAAPTKGFGGGSIQAGGSQERSFARWKAPVTTSQEVCLAV
jgi:hypothetical protein